MFDGGFTSIIDLAFGPDGLLYVTELDEGSWAAIEIFGTPKGGTINACSVQWGFCYEVADDIPQPTAIAFDRPRRSVGNAQFARARRRRGREDSRQLVQVVVAPALLPPLTAAGIGE